MAETRLRSHALGHAQGCGEERVQQRTRGFNLLRNLERFLHLARDLVFADHDAIETAGDAEEMPHGLSIRVFVQVRLNQLGADAVSLGKELRDERSMHRRTGLGPRQVQLDAIAGAEDRGFDAVTSREFGECGTQFRLVEGELLAEFDRCRADVAADGAEVHRPSPATNGWDAIKAMSSKPNAAIESVARRRAGTLVP